MGLVGNKEYGTWKDGSSVYKDSKGYYIVAVNLEGMYKKYLKNWKPAAETPLLCFIKKRWTSCEKKKVNKTRKHRKKD